MDCLSFWAVKTVSALVGCGHAWARIHSEVLSRFSHNPLALHVFETLSEVAGGLVESIDDGLLFFEPVVGIFDAPFQNIILLASEVTGLAVNLNKLFLCLLDLFIQNISAQTLLLLAFRLFSLAHDCLEILRLPFLFNLRPYLHNCVFQAHLVLVFE